MNKFILEEKFRRICLAATTSVQSLQLFNMMELANGPRRNMVLVQSSMLIESMKSNSFTVHALRFWRINCCPLMAGATLVSVSPSLFRNWKSFGSPFLNFALVGMIMTDGD